MKKLFVLLVLLSANNYLFAQPLNDITQREIISDKRILEWEVPNERDIMWQKTVWRVIDVREKMNLPFSYPGAPFFELLLNAVDAGELSVYSPQTDDFSIEMSTEELENTIYKTDTIPVVLDEYNVSWEVVRSDIFYEDIKRFRLKEIWYFDSHDSQMKVRILGIAPLQEVYGEDGYFRYEKPLFWVHYPSSRGVLAREQVFVESNEASRMTWEDLFEMRMFASTISKEGNVRNNRLEDLYSGIDILLSADKIKQEIFNFEHDLWTY